MRVALFITCVGDTITPAVGRAAVSVLERLGVDVEFPFEQTCCGQMHVNSGYGDQILPLVERFVGTFGNPRYDHVVSPSASCVAQVHRFSRLAREAGKKHLAERAEMVAGRVHELSQFLVETLEVEDVGASFPHRVTYHPTCHGMRELGLGEAPLRLLRQVRGIELRELAEAEQCCGFGGTFAVKNAAVSAAMLSDKTTHVIDSGAEVCAAVDASCLLQIGGGLSRQRAGIRTMHLAEILASTG